MRNPWVKKNPLMSMWMSSANAIVGSTRSRVSAHAKRQATTMMTEGAKQMIRFWSGGYTTTPTRKRRKTR